MRSCAQRSGALVDAAVIRHEGDGNACLKVCVELGKNLRKLYF